MKSLVVYFSRFGNTRRVAEATAETMKQAGEARVISLDELRPSDFEGADLVVVGSPTHGFTVPQTVRFALDSLPPGLLAGKSVVAFDTTINVWPLRRLRASPKILRRLKDLRGKAVAPPETFFVRMSSTQQSGEVDLLLEGEIERVRTWADAVLQQSSKETVVE
jgi:flavodoxin